MKRTDWDAECLKDEKASHGNDVELLLRGLLRDSRELLEKNTELVANIRSRNQYRGSGERKLEKIMQKEIHEAMYLQTVIGKLCGHVGCDVHFAADSLFKINRVKESDKEGMRLVRAAGRWAKQLSRASA